MSDIQFNPQSIIGSLDAILIMSYQDALDIASNHHKSSLLRSVTHMLQEIRQQKIRSGVVVTSNKNALQKELSKLSIPRGATISDIKNLALFKMLQTPVKTELTLVSNLLNLLKESDTKLAGQLQPKFAALQEMLNNFPHITHKELAFLKSTLDQCTTRFLNKLPLSKKALSLRLQAEMYLKMAAESKDAFLALKEMGEELLQQANSFKKSEELLKQLQSLLPEEGKTLNPAKIPEILALLSSLMQEYQKLPVDQRREIKKALTALLNMKSTHKTTLAALLSSSILSQWMQELLEEDSSLSPDQLRGALKRRFEQEVDFPEELEESIYTLLEKEKFPEISNIEGISLATVQADTVTLNPTFTLEATQRFKIAESTNKKIAQTLLQASHTSYAHSLEADKRSQGYHKGAEMLGATAPSTSSAGAPSSSASATSLSDQDAFADTVFNVVIPTEMAKLEKLDQILFLNNFAGNFGNNLMNIANVSDFSNAASYYNWSGLLQQTGVDSDGDPVFSGSAAPVTQKLSAEQKQCAVDQTAATALLNQLKQEIARMKNPPTGSAEASMLANNPTEYQNLMTAIQNQIPDVQAAVTQLGTLSTLLKGLIINVYTADPPTFQIYNSQGSSVPPSFLASLTTDETAVATGVTLPGPPPTTSGGLQRVSSALSGFVTKYSDQGSQQQEELQLVMAEFQQLMSIISAALQTWNQCYMAPVQAIGKL